MKWTRWCRAAARSGGRRRHARRTWWSPRRRTRTSSGSKRPVRSRSNRFARNRGARPGSNHPEARIQRRNHMAMDFGSKGSVKSDINVNALPVTAENLIAQVRRVLEDKREKIVYLRADKDAKY